VATEQLGVPPTATYDLLRKADQDAVFPQGTGAWQNYTPTLTQGVTVTKTINHARWTQIGQTVTVQWNLVITGAGTAGSLLTVGLPVMPAFTNQMGFCLFIDRSANVSYIMGAFARTGTQDMVFAGDLSGISAFGATPGVTVANTDNCYGTITYEV
jgi:hypothetical protein